MMKMMMMMTTMMMMMMTMMKMMMMIMVMMMMMMMMMAVTTMVPMTINYFKLSAATPSIPKEFNRIGPETPTLTIPSREVFGAPATSPVRRIFQHPPLAISTLLGRG